MNSQFKNSNFGFYLYAFIIIIIAAASIFVVWYMTTGYRLGTYDEGTRLGSVYIGGLEETEVEPLLEDRITYWLSDETIVFELKYQGYTYEFNRELFYFDLDASTYNIQHGVTNQILVYYSGSTRQEVIDEINNLVFLEDVIDYIDINSIILDVFQDASFMKSYSSKNVEDYLIDPDNELIVEFGSASITAPDGVEIDSLITHVNAVYPDGKILIEEKSLFDIIEKMGASLNDAEMTILSSAMLSLILETNFSINEVHYQPSIDFTKYTTLNYPYYARNSVINQIVSESFSFYNPNESEYYFTIEKVVGSETEGIIKLFGLELIYDVEVTIINSPLEYITLTTKDDTLLQNGYNGAIIEVVRTVTDIYGYVIYDKQILFEFYPPIKEIIYEP